MIKVWVLYVFMTQVYGGPLIIDNIATQQECMRVEQIMSKRHSYSGSMCFEVWKVKP